MKYDESLWKTEIWFLEKSVEDDLSEIKPLIHQLIYFHFRHLHSTVLDRKPGIVNICQAAQLAVDAVKKWWVALVGILAKHNDCNHQYDPHPVHMNLKKGATGNPCPQKEKEFFKGLKKTFWAPKLRYEAILI